MSGMAQKNGHSSLPCLFCGRAFRTARSLTTHLDFEHETWVDVVMSRLGLPCPTEYPIQEYRRALAESFARHESFTQAPPEPAN